MPSNYSVYNKTDKSILITLFKGNAIDLVRRAVCLHSILWPADLDFFCMCMGHDHSSPGLEIKVIESQGRYKNEYATGVSTVSSC